MNRKLQFGLGTALACSLSLSAASELPKLPTVKAWRASASKIQEVTSKPVLNDKSIVFGNKTLRLHPDGKIECMSLEVGQLVNFGMDFWVVDNGKPDWGWKNKNLDKKLSKFSRQGNKYTWELWYGDKETKPFRGITQSLEVLPDGRVKFSANFTLPEQTATRKFAIWTFTFTLLDTQWLNETMSIDGKVQKVDRKKQTYRSTWKQKEVNLTFGVNNPAKKFSVHTDRKDVRSVEIRRLDNLKTFIVFAKENSKKEAFYTVCFDFTKGSPKGDPNAVRGGVNFKSQENMLLPDIHNKNMVTNPSMECGMEGWHRNSSWGRLGEVWYDPITLDSSTAYDGKYSVRFSTNRSSWHSLSPVAGPVCLVCEPGDYTISFYAKGEPGCEKGYVSCWIPNFHATGERIWSMENKCWWKFPLTVNWKRYHATFRVPKGHPLIHLAFYGYNPDKHIHFWIDAIQLEKGKKLSAYQPHPVEGGLFTSDPDNFISDKNKVNGKFSITTAKPNAEGEVRITVLNFFDEKVLVLNKKFKTGSDRKAEIALPLDSIPGRGLYRVFAEYKLKTGETYYDIHRYTKLDFQNKPRPNKQIFCFDYGNPSMYFDYLKRMDRYRKLGVGSKGWHATGSKKIWDIEKSYGIEPLFYNLLCYKYAGQTGPNKSKFYIHDKIRKDGEGGMNLPKGRELIWDHHVEAGGKVTPEYQKKLKNVVKSMVARMPHIPMWVLCGEITCKMHNEWWGKGYTDQDVARDIALLLQAFAAGVREGNPKAKVMQEAPSNMSPKGGIAETDRVLAECNKLGVKFDVIGIHTYRFSPENPDLDDDAQLFFKVLERHGYGKTPVAWPEGMHWGPFDIPQWGTISSSWQQTPRTWRGDLLSYDMSWTEKKSAAWYARSWLVALKYGDRVIISTAGNTASNCFMDLAMTPYAASMMANTLCSILGDAKFKKDVRFAPYMRTYIFEDAEGRPVAAVWNHHEDIDNGKVEAPFVTADFGNNLETVLDIMNSPRAFNKGKIRFQVNSFPLFFRGKPGTLKQMIAAFENAVPDSGKLFKPVTISALPENATTLKLTLKNSLSKDFNGTLNGKQIKIPAASQTIVRLPLKTPLKMNSIAKETISLTLKSNAGSVYTYDIAFNAFLVKHVDDKATFQTLDWNKLPVIQLPKTSKHLISGDFRIGWNKMGLFIESRIKDKKFVHIEYAKPGQRWLNDSLQIFVDTFANARDRLNKGFDTDDYAYSVYPNSKGTSATVFRDRSVESQLGLATQAPPDNTFAPDIPCSFSNKNGVLTYRAFFPAKYLLPMHMQKGWTFGFALFANNSDQPKKQNGPSLSIATDGGGCYNRPHVWPVAILTE